MNYYVGLYVNPLRVVTHFPLIYYNGSFFLAKTILDIATISRYLMYPVPLEFPWIDENCFWCWLFSDGPDWQNKNFAPKSGPKWCACHLNLNFSQYQMWIILTEMVSKIASWECTSTYLPEKSPVTYLSHNILPSLWDRVIYTTTIYSSHTLPHI